MRIRNAMKILAACTLAFCALPASAGGIDFFHGSFDEAVARAHKQKKLVFVDVYTDWCGPCKKMSKTVFVLDEVGATFNKHFVSYKLNAEDAAQKGPELARRFEVKSYPTYLFIDGTGKLIAKKGGAMGPEAFKTVALTATGIESGAKACAAYQSGDHGIDAFVRCFSKKVVDNRELPMDERVKQSMALDTEYDTYFKAVPETKLLSAEGFRLIANAPFLKRGDVAAEFLVKHYPDYEKVVNKDLLAKTAVEANLFGIMTGAFTNPEGAAQWVEDIHGPLAAAYAVTGVESGADPYEWEKAGLASSMAMKKKDWPAFLAAEQRQVDLLPEGEDRTEALAQVGQKLMLFKCEDKNALRVGAGYIAVALDRKDSFGRAVVYGEIMTKIGEKEIAAKAFDKAQALLADETDERKKAAWAKELERARGS